MIYGEILLRNNGRVRMLNLNELISPALLKQNDKEINMLKDALVPEDDKKSDKIKNPNKRLEFILGAGVTASLGFPTWVGLVSQAVGRQLQFLKYPYYLDAKDKKSSKKISDLISKSSVTKAKWEVGVNKGYSDTFVGSDMLEIAEYVLNSFKENVQSDRKEMIDKIANYKVTELVYDCLHMSEEDFKK